MQTVNFQCGHCQKLMAVGTDSLGKQVRCPHCQQVVLAPAPTTAPAAEMPPAPPPAPEPSPAPVPEPLLVQAPPPADEGGESIFGEVMDDDLFGRSSKPVVEMPLEVAPPAPTLEPTFIQLPAVPDLAPTVPGNTIPLSPAPFSDPLATAPASAFAPTQAETNLPQGDAYVGATTEWQSPSSNGPAVMEAPPPAPAPLTTVPRTARRDDSGGKFMIILLINLISYSIGVTAILIYFYFNQRTVVHPLRDLPDVPAQNPGVNKGKEKKVNQVFQRVRPEIALPEDQHVPLGQTIRIGAIEVTPERVEQKRVIHKYRNRGFNPEMAQEDSLILHLKLKNVSEDNIFYPTDPAFERKWKEGDPESAKPYTFLDMVDKQKRFFGGANRWPLPRVAGEEPAREYVEGQENDEKPLYPGEERKTVMYTNPEDRVADYLRGYNGRFVWRVQLRQGLVKVEEREISASTVIGVTFGSDDIR